MRTLVTAALLAGLAASPAAAQGPARQTMTCPIGGASFDYVVPVGAPTVGERPDGKPYGTAAPNPLPECPKNGLVLYKDYSPAEVAKLEPLIGSDAYQAMRRDDTQYYRAYFLMKEMGVKPDLALLALLQAGWEAEGRPKLRARYLAEFAEASAKIEPRPTDIRWIGMEARAVNALRELGRFDEAAARLDKIPTKALDVPAPTGSPMDPASREARTRRGWLSFLAAMKGAIARKDSTLEPFDLLPRHVAIARCLDSAATLNGEQKAFCDTEKTDVAALRQARVRAEEEMKALEKSRDQSGR